MALDGVYVRLHDRNGLSRVACNLSVGEPIVLNVLEELIVILFVVAAAAYLLISLVRKLKSLDKTHTPNCPGCGQRKIL